MVWTLFVLDMDGTYSSENQDSVGVQPFVYLIPLDKQEEVENYAVMAGRDFHSLEKGFGIGDYFEEYMRSNSVEFKPVGSIDLTFGERHTYYLDKRIPGQIV